MIGFGSITATCAWIAVQDTLIILYKGSLKYLGELNIYCDLLSTKTP